MKSVVIYIVLIGIACLQMVGDVIGNRTIKGIGAATAMAPAPKVFTAHEGFETYSSRFFVDWQIGDEAHSLELTPSSYRNIGGPYNRRNAYGAALAYGPVLNANQATQPMLNAVMNYAMCNPGTIRTELAIPAQTDQLQVRLDPIDPASRDSRWQLTYDVDCGESS